MGKYNQLGIPARNNYFHSSPCSVMPFSSLEAGSGGGAAAGELVQSTLDDFRGPIIADKTHDEILSMNVYKRYRWYKIILPEEKERARHIIKEQWRRNLSDAHKGQVPWNKGQKGVQKHSEETRRKIGEASRQRVHSEETRRKRSQSIIKLWEEGFYDNPEIRLNMSRSQKKRVAEHGPNRLGQKHTVIAKKRMSDSARKRYEDPEERQRQSERTKQYMTNPETRKKLSEATTRLWQDPEFRSKVIEKQSGPNAPNWQGGKSFEPYSTDFTTSIKERVRNRDNLTCVMCGKGEILNGRKLDAHHIDSDKMNTDLSNLVSICRSCHNKLKGQKAIELEFVLATRAEEYRRSGL